MKNRRNFDIAILSLPKSIFLIFILSLGLAGQALAQCQKPFPLEAVNSTVCFNETGPQFFEVTNNDLNATINWYRRGTRNQYINNLGALSLTFSTNDLNAGAFVTNTVTGNVYAIDVTQTVNGCESDIVTAYIIQQPMLTNPTTAPNIDDINICNESIVNFIAVVPEPLTIAANNIPSGANSITFRTAIGWNEGILGEPGRSNGLVFDPKISLINKSETKVTLSPPEPAVNFTNTSTSYRREFFVENIKGYNVNTKSCPTTYSPQLGVRVWANPTARFSIQIAGGGVPFSDADVCINDEIELTHAGLRVEDSNGGQSTLYSWVRIGFNELPEEIKPLTPSYRQQMNKVGGYTFYAKLERTNPNGGPKCYSKSNAINIRVHNISIIRQPSNLELCSGKSGYLTVVNTGATDDFIFTNYQWQVNKKGTLLDEDFEADDTGYHDNYPSKYTDTLKFKDVSVALNGYKYRVLVSIASGKCLSTSKVVSLKVNQSPVLDAPLPVQTLVCGTDVTFTVNASLGTGQLNYQWQEDPKTGVFAVKLLGKQLSLNNLTTDNTGYKYKIIVTDRLLCSAESVTTLSVHKAPEITVQPVSISQCATNNATFTVVATGEATLNYQWKNQNANVGENSNTYTIESTSLTDNGKRINVVITDANNCSVISKDALLNVTSSAKVLTQPASVAICPGGDVTFSVLAENPNVSYLWEKSVGMGEFVSIPDKNTLKLTINSVSLPQNGDRYRVLIADNSCSGYSNIATLTVYSPPIIESFAQDFGCIGDNSRLTISVVGDEPLVYSWKADYKTGAFVILQNSTNTLSLNSIDITQNGYLYQVEVRDVHTCLTTSEILNLQVDSPPTMNAVANPSLICNGSKTNIECTNTNNFPETKYRWTVDSPAEITGWTDQTESVNGPIVQTVISSVPEYKSITYTIVPYNGLCPGQAKIITMTVIPVPKVIPKPVATTICTSKNVEIALTNSFNSAQARYKWTVSSPSTITGWSQQTVGVLGPIQQTLTNSEFSDQSLSYKIVARENNCDGPSTLVNILVQSLISITTHPNDLILCANDTYNINVIASGSDPKSYQWYRNDIIINNATDPKYVYSPVNYIDNNSIFKVAVSNLCDTKTSNPSTLKVGKIGEFTEAEITADNYSPEYGSLVQFNYKGPNYPLDWDFGDNSEHSNFENPTHNYFSIGSKVVKLSGYRDPECTKTIKIFLNVKGTVTNPITGNTNETEDTPFFPIPASNEVTAQFSSPPKSIYITSMQGSVVYESGNFSNSLVRLNISSLPTGVYIVIVETVNGLKHFKIIKN